MTAYYNEFDPYAAAWLRNLIAAGHIADGVVDERSIEDVFPDDLREFTQCHFFAGIGVWSYALRRAGWDDSRPVWTGSCPCQPFSEAGKGAGFDDERHLWPHFLHLIQQCRPPALFGEQVASAAAGTWIDLVQDDLEGLGYAFGAVAFPSAGVGAPHIRDRSFWVADADGARFQSGSRYPRSPRSPRSRRDGNAGGGQSCGLADAQQHDSGREAQPPGHRQPQGDRSANRLGGHRGAPGELAHAGQERLKQHAQCVSEPVAGLDASRRDDVGGCGRHGAGAGPTNGAWRAADWLLCRDGRWRPVEPGTFPLAHGAPARVGRLRAYGNAINAEAAVAWINAYEGLTP